MYKITSSEERNEKATEFETKSLFYLMNYYEKSNKVYWLVIDFFNDVTGVDKLQSECIDIQSKGVKKISKMRLGRYLVTLFKNFISEFNFSDYILFIESLSSNLDNELGGKKVFTINDFTESSIKSIKEGLKKEIGEKSYIEVDITKVDFLVDEFVEKVTFVIDSHTKEQCIKDAVKMSSTVIVDDLYLRKIFKEIRDKQSAKKNNNVEGKLIASIGCFYGFDKHIRKEDIEGLIINRICFKSALGNLKSTPKDFLMLLLKMNTDETIVSEEIEKNQNDVFRLLSDKNNTEAYWIFFSNVVKVINDNPSSSLNDLYNKLDKMSLSNIHYLNAMSCKYFIALVKERLK